jgi:eukaryotic-like serine/threonine-protein kinase
MAGLAREAMTLVSGTRLGPYEITAPLGAGGMGEVYRARDTRLSRDVAVKVLPQHLSLNPEVRARFDREAKTISSLNHAHICTLFDVGREGDTDYLVMELVEGETLAARLAKGALPAAEVLRLGSQIADALDRAHRAGVVHRDLKPGNVMLTRSGAKLMDFGLARATGMAGPAGGSGITHAALTQSPTMAAPLTAEGTIVGTFQYMAPEQLEGKEADERSDIWALGCVLYEMATGRRAFEGRSQASLISAIMTSEPPPVSQVAPLAPLGLDRLIRTCLTKDPDERVRTAHDVKLQLLGIQEGGSQSGVATATVAARPARSGRLAWIVAAIAAIAAVAMAILLVSGGRAPRSPVQLALEPPDRSQFTPYNSIVAVSPDGRLVAFCAQDSGGDYGLWLRRFDAAEATRLVQMGAVGGLFWSPDGRALGIINPARRQLFTIPIEGGTPTTLCAAGSGRGGTWSRRGVIVFAPNAQGPLYRIAASGGEPTQVTWPDSSRHEIGHRYPCFLPDGDHFLYASLPPGPDGFDIFAGSLGSRSVQKIMSAQSAPTYAAPGYLLFRRRGKLMAQRFDARRLKLQGDPVALADAPLESELDAEPIATASNDGRLVVLERSTPDTQIGWLDRSGALRGTLSLPAGPWERPVLSPDDRFAVVPNGDDLWRIDLGRSVPLRLTSSGGYHSDPVWSPDGRQIAYTTGRQGREEISLLSSDGSGEPRVLPTTNDLFKLASDWSREGLVLTIISGTNFRDLWLAQPTSGGRVAPLVQTPFAEAFGKVSPDGRWIAYISNEGGTDDVYLQSFPLGGHKTRVSSGGATWLWWMPGSDEICYRTTNRALMMIVKLTRNGEDLEVGEPRLLFRYPLDVIRSDFSHDGQRMLVTYASGGARNRTARVILNWTALVKR